MGSYHAMELEPARLKRVAKAMRQKPPLANIHSVGPQTPGTQSPGPESGAVRLAVKMVKRLDPADRARQRDGRLMAQAIEAKRISGEMAVAGAAKALIAAIRVSENLLAPPLEPLLEDGFCRLEDGETFDPLVVNFDRDGRPVLRLTRQFASWTNWRGGFGEVSAFVVAIKAHPAEAAQLAIVNEAREQYRAAMRRLRDRDAISRIAARIDRSKERASHDALWNGVPKGTPPIAVRKNGVPKGTPMGGGDNG
jgi:hypothetical protein